MTRIADVKKSQASIMAPWVRSVSGATSPLFLNDFGSSRARAASGSACFALAMQARMVDGRLSAQVGRCGGTIVHVSGARGGTP